jgi:hypothetical protein
VSRIKAYDVPPTMAWDQGENAYFVSIRASSAEEVTAYWQGLSVGGTVLQDLAPAGWSPLYGMLQDKFGVVWVLDVQADHAPASSGERPRRPVRGLVRRAAGGEQIAVVAGEPAHLARAPTRHGPDPRQAVTGAQQPEHQVFGDDHGQAPGTGTADAYRPSRRRPGGR